MPTIDVTQAHLDAGIPKDCGKCPIALAIKSRWPDVKRVEVDLTAIRYTRDGRRRVHWTSPGARAILLAIDQGRRDYLRPTRLTLGQVVMEHEAKRSNDRRDKRRRAVRKGKQAPVQRGGRSLERDADAWAIGRRREFGLKAMGRPPELIGQDIES